MSNISIYETDITARQATYDPTKNIVYIPGFTCGYIKSNVAPILVDFLSGNDIKNAVILPANIDSKELNGHYDGVDFLPPKWMSEILGTNASKILIIDKIDSVSKEEQLKFCELLEHRKISTFSLPENCVILVTANEVNKNKISEEIYSLVVQI